MNISAAPAAAPGYVAEASRTDGKKYPKYAAGQAYSNCALYQGKADNAAGLNRARGTARYKAPEAVTAAMLRSIAGR